MGVVLNSDIRRTFILTNEIEWEFHFQKRLHVTLRKDDSLPSLNSKPDVRGLDISAPEAPTKQEKQRLGFRLKPGDDIRPVAAGGDIWRRG